MTPSIGIVASSRLSAVAVAVRMFFTGANRTSTVYYNDGAGGAWTTHGTAMPAAGALGSSSKIKTNSNRFYFWGNDTPSHNCYSTDYAATSWRTENAPGSGTDWSMGSYVNTRGFLLSVGNYTNGNRVRKGVVDSGTGAVTWSDPGNYPVYASAPSVESLTSKVLVMGGYFDNTLAGKIDTVYSTEDGVTWTAETVLPFTPNTGYLTSAALIGAVDSRVYICNSSASTLYSRGDSSGTWTSEGTLTNGANAIGTGIFDGVTYTLQFADDSAVYFQTVNANGAIPALGAWTLSGSTLPVNADTGAYRGWLTA